MRQFLSPKGYEISGVVQKISGLAFTDLDQSEFNENGTIKDLVFAGETDVGWDSAEDVLYPNAERMFQDVLGNYFSESEIHWIDPENGVDKPVLLRAGAVE